MRQETDDLHAALQNIPAELPGVVCIQYVTRGKKRHAYHARFWRERGKLRKQYVRKCDVEAVRAACAARQAAVREQQAHRGKSPPGVSIFEWRAQRRQINAMLREAVGDNMPPSALRKLLYRR
jgi:hypothetical protein